jgi:SAM-dependent methyltransferase
VRLSKVIRRAWKACPEAVKDGIRTFPPVAAWRAEASRRHWRHQPHDRIYDGEYFEFVEKTTAPGADVMATAIRLACRPTKVLDVGCGTGALLASLRAQGVGVVGLERASAGLAACRRRGLDVRRFDIGADQAPAIEGVDLVVSMEVGQQLPESQADRYIDLLCSYAAPVAFSADRPGGGDRNPMNERPPAWWVEKFERRGYAVDHAVTALWRRAWKSAGLPRWFHENVMLLRRHRQLEQVAGLIASP